MSELDPDRIEAISRTTIAAVDDVVADAKRLAAVEIEASSPDRRVRVKVTATGAITEFRLLDNVLRRYDTNALGELVTRTIREAQRKALQTYERELVTLEPPEVARADEELKRIWRD
jgi:DNA-binding protein YbaB